MGLKFYWEAERPEKNFGENVVLGDIPKARLCLHFGAVLKNSLSASAYRPHMRTWPYLEKAELSSGRRRHRWKIR